MAVIPKEPTFEEFKIATVKEQLTNCLTKIHRLHVERDRFTDQDVDELHSLYNQTDDLRLELKMWEDLNVQPRRA